MASPNHIWAGLNTVTELAKQTDLNSLKTSVSSGKALIASAITGKGVSTSSTASFSTMAANINKLGDAPKPVFDFAPTIGKSINVGISGIIVHVTSSLVYVCYSGGQVQLASTSYGNVPTYSRLPIIDTLETTFKNNLQSIYAPFAVKWTQLGKSSYVNIGTRSQYKGGWSWFKNHTGFDYASYLDMTWTCDYSHTYDEYANYYIIDWRETPAVTSAWPTWHRYRCMPAYCLSRSAFAG